jgi:hypothetical protein
LGVVVCRIINFWVISNLLGMGCYLWIASSGWMPVGTVIAGSPGFGDALFVVPCMLILFTFSIVNLIVLGKRNTKFSVWFIIAGLWFFTLGYDLHHSPSFEEPPSDILDSQPKQINFGKLSNQYR